MREIVWDLVRVLAVDSQLFVMGAAFQIILRVNVEIYSSLSKIHGKEDQHLLDQQCNRIFEAGQATIQ